MSAAMPTSSLWFTLLAEGKRCLVRRHYMLLVIMAATALLAAILLAAGIDNGELILLGFAFYAPFTAGLVVMSGIVSDERASGVIVLWLQKPALLSRSYTIRYGLYLLLLSILTAGFGILIASLGMVAGLFTAGKAFRLGIGMLPLALIPAAMVFAFSAWGVRRDAILAFLTIVIGVSVAGVTSFERGPANAVSRFLAFPIDAVLVVLGSRPQSLELTQASAIIIAHLAGWSLIGFLGLRVSERILQRA